jgi:hypothetical protein
MVCFVVSDRQPVARADEPNRGISTTGSPFRQNWGIAITPTRSRSFFQDHFMCPNTRHAVEDLLRRADVDAGITPGWRLRLASYRDESVSSGRRTAHKQAILAELWMRSRRRPSRPFTVTLKTDARAAPDQP